MNPKIIDKLEQFVALYKQLEALDLELGTGLFNGGAKANGVAKAGRKAGAKRAAVAQKYKGKKKAGKKAGKKRGRPKKQVAAKGGAREVLIEKGTPRATRFKKLVEKAATAEGSSLKAVLEKAGVNYLTHYSIMHGKSNITRDTLQRYSKAIPEVKDLAPLKAASKSAK